MQTHCPHCETVFRVSEEQLALAEGQVRCGECDHIFNARDTLIEEGVEQQANDTGIQIDTVEHEYEYEATQIDIPGFEIPPTHREGTEAAVDRGSEAVAEDVEAGPAQPEEQSPAAEETPGMEDEASTTSSSDSHDAEIDSRGYQPQALYPELNSALVIQAPPSLFRTLAGALAILALLMLLVGQFAYFQRDSLARHAGLRPLLDKLCQVLDCRIAATRAPQSVRLLRHEVTTHPGRPDALSVTAVIVNEAGFTQAYPVLRLRFLDVDGRLLAQRDFLPAEYLPADVDAAQGMRSGEPVNTLLELFDPGNKAVSYEFDFL
ncbi:MAG: DUF3426 domain-containing protein [Granulosicoccaceae bacterium]|jgi:predicted Zn finger-like uncharacterized protein